MKRKIELLAPGGDIESIKAAIVAGADAIYLGLNVFNARYRATNIEFDDLHGIVNLAHRNSCEIFIIIIESEIRALITLLNRLANTKIDGIIVQDLGLFYLLTKYFKHLKIHASTQLTTHNEGQIKFLSQLNATRVNLSRELNLTEIKSLTRVGHKHDISSEVFVHGSNCLSFSGICYISSVQEGKSGNRGRCSQPCRDQYLTTPAGKDFPLNLKDNSAFNDLRELYDTGVDALKIEGRIKKFNYVYTVVKSWRDLLDNFYNTNQSRSDDTDLYRVFNRDFTNAFLKGAINKDMFIDNPRDNSARHFSQIKGRTDDEGIQQTKQELYDLRTRIMTKVRAKVAELNDDKSPLKISVTGESGRPLNLSFTSTDASFAPFAVRSESALVPMRHESKKTVSQEGLNYENLYQWLESINNAEYTIEVLELDNLQSGLFLPQKELTALKKRIIFVLNDGKETVAPIETPRLKKPMKAEIHPTLSVLISSSEHLAFVVRLPPIVFSTAESLSRRLFRIHRYFFIQQHVNTLVPVGFNR
jgi:putative protease